VDVRVGHQGFSLGATTVKPFAGVSNVLDEQYVSSVVVNSTGGTYYEPGPARSFSLGVNVAW